MLDPSIYQKAIRFAGEKHHNQTVPGSNSNYLLHLSNVAMEVITAYMHKTDFNLNLAVQLALLHDTVEDTETTPKEIEENFSAKVAEGIVALTKDKHISDEFARMQDSLKRIKATFKEVSIVKLADRITNLQPPPDTWNTHKVDNYKDEAKLIATELKGANIHLDQRIRNKISEYVI